MGDKTIVTQRMKTQEELRDKKEMVVMRSEE